MIMMKTIMMMMMPWMTVDDAGNVNGCSVVVVVVAAAAAVADVSGVKRFFRRSFGFSHYDTPLPTPSPWSQTRHI